MEGGTPNVERQEDIDTLLCDIAMVLTGETMTREGGNTGINIRKRRRTFSSGLRAFERGIISGWNTLPVFQHFLQCVEVSHRRLRCMLHTPFVTSMLQCFVHAQLRSITGADSVLPEAPLRPHLDGVPRSVSIAKPLCPLAWYILGAVASLKRMNAFGAGLLFSCGRFDPSSPVWEAARTVVHGLRPSEAKKERPSLESTARRLQEAAPDMASFLVGYLAFYGCTQLDELLAAHANYMAHQVTPHHPALDGSVLADAPACGCERRGLAKTGARVIQVLATPNHALSWLDARCS